MRVVAVLPSADSLAMRCNTTKAILAPSGNGRGGAGAGSGCVAGAAGGGACGAGLAPTGGACGAGLAPAGAAGVCANTGATASIVIVPRTAKPFIPVNPFICNDQPGILY